MVFNTTANAITDGLKFGTSAGGTDVVSARSVTANAFTFVPDANLAKRVFSTTVDQTIYFDAVTAWNSANVNIAVHLAKVF
jgi:quinolinate synthase